MTKYNKMLRFLKDNGIYHSFKKNYFEQPDFRRNYVKSTYLKSLCQKLSIRQIVLYSFDWTKTKEGFNFWSSVYDGNLNTDF